MSVEAASTLAGEVGAGTFSPTALGSCEKSLVGDKSSQFISFVELTLFADPGLHAWQELQYLAVQPQVLQQLSAAEQKRQVQEHIRPLAERVLRDLPTAGLPGPRADAAKMRDTLKRIWATTSEPSWAGTRASTARGLLDPRRVPRVDNLTDAEVKSRYVEWLTSEENRVVRERLEPLTLLGLVRVEARPTSWTVDALTAELAAVLYPQPFHPLGSAHAHVALCSIYEQEWKQVGYTRGELVGSLGLAPGERLTLEFHSWDKSTRKTEDELATESEIRTSETFTQRDALTVAQEYAKKTNTKVEASGVVPIPKMPVKVGATAASEVNQGHKRTTESIREKTVESTHSLKANRKIRIESSREIGREERQTRVIENTNRCHTLNCHYFEVLANYLVTTRLVDVRPCVLLPNARPVITLDWVLCHQHILIAALLDKVFLPGFNAAQRLKTDEVLRQMREARYLTELAKLGDEVAPYVQGIVTAYDLLTMSKNVIHERLKGCRGVSDVFKQVGCYVRGVDGLDSTYVPRAVAWARLPAHTRTALELMRQEWSSSANPAESLKRFFRSVSVADFANSVTGARLISALHALGFPSLFAGVWARADPTREDDAGLRNAVESASALVASLGPQGPEPRDSAAELEVAEARTHFEQLRCHINDNWLHYLQAVWLREDPAERFLRLQGYGGLTHLIDNELVGFVADKSAYPLRQTGALKSLIDALKPMIDFEKTTDEAKKLIEGGPSPATLVTLPTPGTILEAVTGECDACEDFIQTSRTIDLRSQDAKAKADESEAKRREMRLTAADLTDPTAHPSSEVTLKIQTEDGAAGG